MLAAQLWGHRDIRIVNINPPRSLKSNEVLLRILSVGICGSDLLIFSGRPDQINQKYPIILGHEFTAEIKEIGSPGILDGNFQILNEKTRVAVDPNISCNICEFCLHGNPNLCIYPNKTGLNINGALSEFLIVDSRMCYPLHNSINNDVGTLVEPLSVAMHNVQLGNVSVGKNIAILGAGPIGLLLLLVCKMAGADKIYITDSLEWRLKIAKNFGAETINILNADPVKAIKSFTNNRGVDVVFEVAWVDETTQQAIEIAIPGGKIVLVGIPKKEDTLNICHSMARGKGLTLLFSKRTKYYFSNAMRIIEKNLIDFQSIISHKFPLNETQKAFELNSKYAEGVIKTIINVG